MKKHDLEERLIDFSVSIIELTDMLNNSRAGTRLAGQLVRSGTSVSLNYGEARSGESKRDFLHKMKVVLKELRESHICLKIIKRAKLCVQDEMLEEAIDESNQIISIFVKSIVTAQNNMNKLNK